MKQQAICEYCGEVFGGGKEDCQENYLHECVNHEITHLNLESKFKENLKEALHKLDKKYNMKSEILKVNVSACWDEYYGKDITYEFDIHNKILDNRIEKRNFPNSIVIPYEDKENVPTYEYIFDLLDKSFFMPNIDKKFEGVFDFESYQGGYGEDDYKVGDVYMSKIYNKFKGKKVKIELINEAKVTVNDLYENFDEIIGYSYYCSGCKEPSLLPIFKYCPNCGVKINWDLDLE
jgi:hypothetical protein